MILLIDNYDSFTFNLVHFFGDLGAECVVRRNDTLTPEEAMGLRPEAIVAPKRFSLFRGPRSSFNCSGNLFGTTVYGGSASTGSAYWNCVS